MLHLVFAFDHWLFHPLIGRGYQLYSGIGGCFLSIGLFGGLFAWLRKHNCHAKGCWRLGKHPVEGSPFTTCARHHPTVPDRGASVEHIRAVQKRTRVSRPKPSKPPGDP